MGLGAKRFATLACAVVFLSSCGVDPKRDLSMEGAGDLFKKRLYAKTPTDAERRQQKIQAREAARANQPDRRRTLQIRIPADEATLITPFNASLIGGNSLLSSVSSVPGSRFLSRKRNVDVKQRELEQKKRDLERFIKKTERALKLDEEAYRFDIEKIILASVIDLDAEITALKQQTVIGFSQNNIADNLAFFGRSQLGAPDRFIDLQESFFFVGNSLTTGVALGRQSGHQSGEPDRESALRATLPRREMTVNFTGLALPVALRSLADSINLSVYFSPDLQASKEPVFLNVPRTDTLDILDILIDNHEIAMAYDREMSIARFYTRAEFDEMMRLAIAAATNHNRIAKLNQDIARAENNRAELMNFYEKYFKTASEDARIRSIESILTMSKGLTKELSATLISIKEAAFNTQSDISTKRTAYEAERRVREDEIFMLEHQVSVLKMALAEARNAPPPKDGEEDGAENRVGNSSALGAVFQEVSVVKDASLATTEPVFTDRFTIYHQEANDIKASLDNYFAQLYPQDLPLNVQASQISSISRTDVDLAKITKRTNEDGEVVTETLATPGFQDDRKDDDDFRPPKISTDKTAVVLTGLKPDIDLANQLIEELDIPAKQVLVEVFMVNVSRNWQRKLEVSLDSVPNFMPDGFNVDFATNIARTSLNNNVAVSKPGGDLEAMIEFMEMNNIGRTISSPTILAKDAVQADITRSITRFREVITQEPTGETNSVTGTPIFRSVTNYEAIEARLNLRVTPTINVLNDHVTLEIDFEDSSFLGEDATSPQLSNNISTSMDAAPGDVIVLAGLYKETNQRNREALPGLSGVPLLGTLLGGSQDDMLQSDEMVIFLAPTVITPLTGVTPANMVR